MANVPDPTGAVPGFEPPVVPSAIPASSASEDERKGCWNTLDDISNIGTGCELGCCAMEGCAGCSSVLVLAALLFTLGGGSVVALFVR